MLSILIPCYNYPTYDLVNTLFDQCQKLKISFEILVSEDGGDHCIEDNKKIGNLDGCQYIINKTNLGRSGNINRLLNRAKFNLKLILDCDVWPRSNQFIDHYLKYSSNFETFVCFGGIAYDDNFNNPNNLRFNYGVKREAKSAKYRRENPVKSLLTSNLLLKNCNQLFDERIVTYGYEDLVFAQNINQSTIEILHIDNPALHKNLESNESYLLKTQNALKTLVSLEKKHIIKPNLTRISKIYHAFSKYYLVVILKFSHKIFAKIFYNYLLKYGRPIRLFDIYKLLFFSKQY